MEDENSRDVFKLKYLIEKFECTVIQTTPSVWRSLLRTDWTNENRAKLISGGEKLTASLAHKLTKITPSLWNVYGPTETTIWSMAHQVKNPNEVCLGNPITDTYCHILNRNQFPAALGSYGELFIGGVGIAKEYLGLKQKSKEAFHKDPINNKLIYQTGDLVHINPENRSLTFTGRYDRQIKRYGIRIDLAEIEYALSSIQSINHAVVTPYLSDNNYTIHAFINTTKENISKIQKTVKKMLPYYLVPDYFHKVDRIPITNRGKPNYPSLHKYIVQNKIVKKSSIYDDNTVKWLINWCKKEFNQKSVASDDNFFSIGGTSLTAIKLAHDLSEHISLPISPIDIFKYRNIHDLANSFTLPEHNNPIKHYDTAPPTKDHKFAIIGMAIKLPNINSADDLWSLVKNKQSTIKHYSESELKDFGVPDEILSLPNFKPVFSHIEDLFEFDADFFKFTPKEAKQTDPQHRILLELSLKALDDANITLDQNSNNIGIFANCHNNNYLKNLLSDTPDTLTREKLSLDINSEPGFLATKIAYHLGLSGPAISINTACSSGLVCVSEACKSLLANEADVMLAAAASITLPHQIGYIHEEGHIFSKSGQCQPFSRNSDGTVPGSGAAVVVLKPLSKALADDDKIYATIEGFSVNNDGQRKATYTAPSSDAHAECIKKALATSGVNEHHVAHIEAHGTGTEIGDPIELEAFKQTYKSDGPIYLGAIKSNVGHTNTAAGLVGLIKLALSRYNNLIPESIYHDAPIESLEESAFSLPSKSITWPADKPYGGISSLGIGGTNCHIIIGPGSNIQNDAEKNIKTTILSHKIFDISQTPKRAETSRENQLIDFSSSLDSLSTIFKEVLGYDSIEPNDDFFDLGGDSIGALDLVAHIEKEFAVSVGLDEIQNDCSITFLAEILQKKQENQPAFNLIKLNNAIKKPPLVLIHPGNGNAYHYRLLAESLLNKLDVCAINYPIGKEIFSSIEEMSSHYIELIEKELNLGATYYLGGWSYGATVAQEMVYQLEKAKKPTPDLLVLIDGWAKYNKNLTNKRSFFEAFFDTPNQDIESLKDKVWLETFWTRISNRMKALVNHTPNVSNQKTLLIKADPYPTHYVDENLPKNGWKNYIQNKIIVRTLPCSHNKILQYENVNLVTELLLNLEDF